MRSDFIELFFKEIKKVFVTLFIIDICLIIAAIPLGAVNVPLFLGILLGNVYTVLHFLLLGMVVQNALERDAVSAKRYMKNHYFLRFLLTGTILAVSFTSPLINGLCVMACIFAPKLTYTAIGIYQSIKHKKDVKEEKDIGH